VRLIAAAIISVLALVAAPTSTAKDFRPGDLSLCSARHCIVLTDRPLLRALASFIYGPAKVVPAHRLRPGAPVLQLRYRDGYVPGLVGGARLGRFRSHGVFCGRFHRGGWYRVPAALARDLRRAAHGLTPLRLSGRVPPSC
jgi:hypothetical protein